MREIFGSIVSISILGPFFFNWWALGIYLFEGENFGYDNLMYYVWGSVWFVWNFFEMIVQIILIPSVMDWIESAPIQDNTENLMAVIPQDSSAKLFSIADF